MSELPIAGDYIKAEGIAGRMNAKLMAIVAGGDRGRVYLAPTPEHESIAHGAEPTWMPDVEIPPDRRSMFTPLYGLTHFKHLFTDRQLVALTTFSDLVGEARERVRQDAIDAGMPDDGTSLRDEGDGAMGYVDAVGVYLGIALSRLADICNALCRWEVSKTQVRNLFGRQAIPMVWDFGENNVFGGAAGDYTVSLGNMAKALDRMPISPAGFAYQADAQTQSTSDDKVVSTDPPYYDNIGYADLSDFFYVWLRQSLRQVFPDLFATLSTPKVEELVATPYRHGTRAKAEEFFLKGMTHSIQRLAESIHPAFAVTVYYAFKQSESKGDEGIASTGWETFLDAVIQAGFAVTGTWPVRTELGNRLVGMETNALASSIVLVCRPRVADASVATRREFLDALRSELPEALRKMQQGNIAPVDLAQAAIGPGMAIFSRYVQVLDSSGAAVSVREALALINETLDEALAGQEGDFDADTRWALAWFDQSGFSEGEYGVAETLSTAKNTSVAGMVEAGILTSGGGKVRLLAPAELPQDWNPKADSRRTVWETTHHLVRVHSKGGDEAAADIMASMGATAETARDLAYRLYRICDLRNRPQEALGYNALVPFPLEYALYRISVSPVNHSHPRSRESRVRGSFTVSTNLSGNGTRLTARVEVDNLFT